MTERDIAMDYLCSIVDTQESDSMVYTMNRHFKTKQAEPTSATEISYTGHHPYVVEQCLNVFDEVEELRDAIADNDKDEIADALGDILTFGYGAIYILNVTDPSELIANYTTKINNPALDDISSAVEVLHSMFSSDNTVGNIIEAVVFAEHWSKRLGIDLLPLMRAVTKSNYTKLIFAMEEAIDTYIHYREKLGVESLYFKYDSFYFEGRELKYAIIFSGADQLDKKNKQYRKDKFLKSVKFVEPSEFVEFNS